MDVDRRLGENRALRQRLEVLLAEGRRNEQIFSRHRRIELGLMEGATFQELFEMLFTELKRINGYDAVTLALCDPDHELRRPRRLLRRRGVRRGVVRWQRGTGRSSRGCRRPGPLPGQGGRTQLRTCGGLIDRIRWGRYR